MSDEWGPCKGCEENERKLSRYEKAGPTESAESKLAALEAEKAAMEKVVEAAKGVDANDGEDSAWVLRYALRDYALTALRRENEK